MSVPQDLTMQAEEIGAGMDQAQAQGMQMMIPRGQFSSQAMKALMDEINMFMQMMNQQPIPVPEGDVTEFPMDVVQIVMAIMAIAEQAGVPIEMSLSDIKSDQEVAQLVAMLKRAIGSQQFKDFLSQAMEGEQPTEEVEVEEEVASPEGEMTDEELFASRM